MDKRYQIFVSSTYKDLINERQEVFQTLMEMDCIPAGMEYFSAIDEDQFEFIKKVIDDCDYYLLIIGGKYGSLAEDHISYTEKEFDYAISKGKKAVVLVHKNPASIPAGKSESEPKIRLKLEAFKKKAMTGRLVDFWEDTKDLKGIVALSMNKNIKRFPEIGWVRGNQVASQEILKEINDLRKENETLKAELKVINRNDKEIEGIANMDSVFRFSVFYTEEYEEASFYDAIDDNIPELEFEVGLSWEEIFLFSAEFLLKKPSKGAFSYQLALEILEENLIKFDSGRVEEEALSQILWQFMANNLIETSTQLTRNDATRLLYSLTTKGKKLLLTNKALC